MILKGFWTALYDKNNNDLNNDISFDWKLFGNF
jgi:hypothetical protein